MGSVDSQYRGYNNTPLSSTLGHGKSFTPSRSEAVVHRYSEQSSFRPDFNSTRDRGRDITVESSLAVRPGQYEDDLQKQFVAIMKMVQAGLSCQNPSAEAHLAVECNFDYKKRMVTGGALHVAALYRNKEKSNLPADADGARLVNVLVKYFKADVHEDCHYLSYKKPSTSLALHLAAGRGNVEVIQALLDNRADIAAKTKIRLQSSKDYTENVTALHEAVHFAQDEAVKLLLRLGADTGLVDARNMHGQTCCHQVAKQGDAFTAKLLVEGKADIDICGCKRCASVEPHTRFGCKKKIPLIIAVQHGRFPRSKLHLFAKPHIDSILLVAGESPKAALEMLVDEKSSSESGSHVIHPVWQSVLKNIHAPNGEIQTESSEMMTLASNTTLTQGSNSLGGTDAFLEKFVDLFLIAPQAACELLNSSTVEPEVSETNRHGLPRRAKIYRGEDMRCWYCTDDKWLFDGEKETKQESFPEWHARFAIGMYGSNVSSTSGLGKRSWYDCCRGLLFGVTAKVESVVQDMHEGKSESVSSEELVSVNINVVGLPGVICPKVFYALTSTKRLDVFATLPVQAIVQCTWRAVGKWFYAISTFFRLMELLILILWVAYPDKLEVNGFFRRCTWSGAAAIVSRDVISELHEVTGYIKLQKFKWYITNCWNVADYAAVAMMYFLLFNTWEEFEVKNWSHVLCGILLFRWAMVIINFRPMNLLGKQISPLLNSMGPMTGIIFVTVMFFMCFLHAFMAIELTNPDKNQLSVFLGTFGLLLVGDGGGIETILTLGGVDSDGTVLTRALYVATVMIFCVILLNLFIAVHSEAYSTAHEKAEVIFLQDRADVCLKCLLRPCWPPTFLGYEVLPSCLHRLKRAKIWAHLVCAAIAALACGLLTLKSLHPIWPACIFLFSITVWETLVLQRPWDKEQSRVKGPVQDHFLWICSRADHDPSSIAPSESTQENTEASSKNKSNSSLTVVRQMTKDTARRLGRQVSSLRQSLSKDLKGWFGKEVAETRLQVEETRQELCRVSEKLEKLETSMSDLVKLLNPNAQAARPRTAPQELSTLRESGPVELGGTLELGSVRPGELAVQPHLYEGRSVTNLVAAIADDSEGKDELEQFLRGASLHEYLPMLKDKFRAVSIEDLFELEESDMQEAGFQKLERKRMQRALKKYSEEHLEARPDAPQRHASCPGDASRMSRDIPMPPPPPPPGPPPSVS